MTDPVFEISRRSSPPFERRDEQRREAPPRQPRYIQNEDVELAEGSERKRKGEDEQPKGGQGRASKGLQMNMEGYGQYEEIPGPQPRDQQLEVGPPPDGNVDQENAPIRPSPPPVMESFAAKTDAAPQPPTQPLPCPLAPASTLISSLHQSDFDGRSRRRSQQDSSQDSQGISAHGQETWRHGVGDSGILSSFDGWGPEHGQQ